MDVCVRMLSACIRGFFGICLAALGMYALYCLWDNSRVLEQAEWTAQWVLREKPGQPGQETLSFQRLQAQNPDVRAWLTLENTKIDLPVVQGKNNLEYLNQDFYGAFSLAGTVFLDSGNRKDFSDSYSILYGHHMERGLMFGDLDRFRDQSMADASGQLILPGEVHPLKIYACLVVPARDPVLFSLSGWEQKEQREAYLQERSLWYRPPGEEGPTLALTTCAGDYRDARTVVLAQILPEQGEEGRKQ